MNLSARLSPLLMVASLAACDNGPTTFGGTGPGPNDPCDISSLDIFDGGVARHAIPALTDPIMTGPGAPAAAYIRPDDRVVESCWTGRR
ncbi:MAG: hypothetical protein WD960_09620 [Gemmatimonadota bacterium]